MISVYDQPGRLYTSLAMQVAAYILGTIVTRMCAVLLVSKQQPGRLYLGLSIMHTYNHLPELNAEVKPSRLLSKSLSLPRATLAPGYLHRTGRCVLPSRQALATTILSCVIYLPPRYFHLASSTLSLFCAKWYFYPISRKIVSRYFARNYIFTIFAAK